MFLLAKVSYLFLTTCKVVVFSRAGQSRSVEDTNALISAECLCHPLFLLCTSEDVACFPPRGVCAMGWGRVFPRLEQKLTSDNNHLVLPGRGLGTSAMAKDLDVTLDTPPSSLRGTACAAAWHNPLGTSEAPLGALGDSRLSCHG